MEACVSGQTKYSVADAIQKFASLNRRFPIEDEERKKGGNDADSDSERWFLYFLTSQDCVCVCIYAHIHTRTRMRVLRFFVDVILR